jgi:nucleoside-diphosphate-sugar epimerase
MLALVTGAAGFIGSTLADQLLVEGWTVRGIDSFSPSYSEVQKRENLSHSSELSAFDFIEADLRTTDLSGLLDGVDVVFHTAAQPGVRSSFHDLDELVLQNLGVTGRLLEAAKDRPPSRFVFASSSSVYGNASVYPTDEGQPLHPDSPYAVTKAAAEQLCAVFASNFGIPAVVLRYFTVYGPRQRPDMAFHRLFESVLDDRPFVVNGDGSASREFTFVDDVVAATISAATADLRPGETLNIAGGSVHSMTDVVALISEVAGAPVRVEYGAAQPGEARRTNGELHRANDRLGWAPQVPLRSGLAAQLEWHRRRRQ